MQDNNGSLHWLRSDMVKTWWTELWNDHCYLHWVLNHNFVTARGTSTGASSASYATSFSVALDDDRRAAEDVAIAKSIKRGDDWGFLDYWWRTTEGSRNMMPLTRLAEAYYPMSNTVKLRYLFRSLWKEGLWRKPEDGARRLWFLLFVHWPIVMWLTEMFLDCMGLRYVTAGVEFTSPRISRTHAKEVEL